jgi:hypothetical protein
LESVCLLINKAALVSDAYQKLEAKRARWMGNNFTHSSDFTGVTHLVLFFFSASTCSRYEGTYKNEVNGEEPL